MLTQNRHDAASSYKFNHSKTIYVKIDRPFIEQYWEEGEDKKGLNFLLFQHIYSDDIHINQLRHCVKIIVWPPFDVFALLPLLNYVCGPICKMGFPT